MLIAIGATVASAQMYTNYIDNTSIEMSNAQGNTDDTLKFSVWDPTASYTLAAEDEVHVIDEADPNGWPSCNLLTNGSFEGAYSGGLAPSWAMTSNKTTGTITGALSANSIFGAAAQQVAYSNLNSGAWANLYQSVTLPTSENGVPLRAQPYYFSVWYFVSAAFAGANLGLGIDWYDKNNTYLSTTATSAATAPGVSYSWQRMSINGYAPATATSCRVYPQYVTTSGTNSGTVRFDGAQLEYATFGAYASSMFGIGQLDNPLLQVSGGASVSDGWFKVGGQTGVTYSSGNINGNTGQTIACSSAPAASATIGIGQGNNPFNPLENYTLTLSYWVSVALAANTRVTLGFQWQDKNGATLGSLNAYGPAGEGVSQALETLTLSIGPGTANRPPAGAVNCNIYAGLSNTVAAHTDTVFLNAVTVTPGSAQTQPTFSALTALQAGMYPSPYINEALAGDYTHMVWHDREITNLYYRAQRLFGGYIRHAKKSFTDGPECIWDIDAVDFGVILSEALIVLVVRGQNITYQPTQGQADNAAISAACVYAHNQGYLKGLDWTTHVANLTTIPAMSFNWVTVRDALAAIADVTIAAYWVDPYRYLWYQAALSISTGFQVSMTPDYVTTYPFEEWSIDYDSTQTRTTSVIQGSTQLSSPTTSPTMYAYVGTNQGAITNGSTYTTANISPNNVRISEASGILLGPSGTGVTVTTDCDILPTPTVAPSLSAATGSSSFASGTVTVQYAWVYQDPNGGALYATAPSPGATVTVSGTGQVVSVGAIAVPTSGSASAAGLYGIYVYVSNAANSATVLYQQTVTATNNTLPAFSISGYGTGGGPAGAYVTIPIQSITPTSASAVNDAATTVRFTVNGGAPLYNVTAVTVNGANKTVGMATATTSGYNCYADPQPAQITFDPSSYPVNGDAIVVTFTFENPVLVRVTTPASTYYTTNGRLIAFYQNVTNIQSIADAIDQANAQLAQYFSAQPLGHLRLHWPPCPSGANPHQGQYITVYHPPSLGSQPVKFQIQRVTTKILGNGIIVRDFELGFYRPDFATQMSQVTQDASHLASDLNASSVLNDVDTVSDSWAITDAVSGAVSNSAVWGTNNWNDGTAFA